ncbi:MAG: PEP-CTERM sorting domain-containing protein [Paucibacter sp.]|nr:PEP-CTERM sorting domain-containing protein [Roseateles sp.]
MKTSRTSGLVAALLLTLGSIGSSASAQTSVVDFSNGTQGWHNPVNSWIDSSLGNAAPAYRTQMIDTFGLTWTNTNKAVLEAFAPNKTVTLGLDFQALSIVYLGNEVSRHVVVELRDYDNPSGNYPWTSVWFDMGTVNAATQGWKHLSVTIDNTSATTLPTGWGGFGDENANAEPILPAGRTFADVLANADSIVFTTFVPGNYYGYTSYDIAIDNISISSVSAVPEPSTLALGIAGLGLLACRVRRRR